MDTEEEKLPDPGNEPAFSMTAQIEEFKRKLESEREDDNKGFEEEGKIEISKPENLTTEEDLRVSEIIDLDLRLSTIMIKNPIEDNDIDIRASEINRGRF